MVTIEVSPDSVSRVTSRVSGGGERVSIGVPRVSWRSTCAHRASGKSKKSNM